MRLRYIPEAEPALRNDKVYVIHDLQNMKLNWKKLFPNNKAPLKIEIGMGKGQFIMHHAQQNSYVNFIGIEKYASPLFLALKKIQHNNEKPLLNLRLILADVTALAEQIPVNSVDTIFLNFSDPWPKKRHTKRRLTATSLLKNYQQWLKPTGCLVIKTDNTGLYKFSLENLIHNNWKIVASSEDLYNSQHQEGNIPTEYENKFRNLGQVIYYIKAAPIL